MVDYLVLPRLKTLAGTALAQHLNFSNCVSIYQFAEQYSCAELISYAKKFILANFIAVTKTEEFLNLSAKEIEQFISSDDIEVSTEEDVFKLILTWVDHNKAQRKEQFPQLFRQVRLVHVSPT